MPLEIAVDVAKEAEVKVEMEMEAEKTKEEGGGGTCLARSFPRIGHSLLNLKKWIKRIIFTSII